MKGFIYRHNEVFIWILALVLIYCTMSSSQAGKSLCFFRWLGWDHCLGCGLGRSMHAAMHGRFSESWNLHFMGIPAIFIISGRILSLIITPKTTPHEQLPDGPARPAA